jgi:glycosyltransferase involved in cell wall biosynthesis
MNEKVTKRITFAKNPLPTLSVAMIVKNEEETLPRLLHNIKDVVDEIVVVDTGSTDKTKEIAEQYGAKIFEYPWDENFSNARNESLKHCTKEYIIWLDADDFVPAQEISKLKYSLKDFPEKRAVFVNLIDRRPDKEYQSVQLRVFPNIPNIGFEGRVHEQISFSLERQGIKYETVPVNVYHLGYTTDEAISVKLRRNLDLLYKEMEEHGKDDFLRLLNTAKSHIGLQEYGKAGEFTDLAIDMVRKNTANVSIENMFIAVLTKINLESLKGTAQTVKVLLEEFKEKFIHLPVYRLSYGEILYLLGEYEETYKMLYLVKDDKITLGLIPLDYRAVMNSMSLLFLFTCLALGDEIVAEEMVKAISGKKEFKMSKIWS